MSDITKGKDQDISTDTKPVQVSSRQALMKGLLGMAPMPTNKELRPPRLIFALDATASREPTWEMACKVQREMFKAVGGGLQVQLVFYGGKKCQAGPWVGTADELSNMMMRITCETGFTQIRKVLSHAVKEAQNGKLKGLVFVGDCYEEEPQELAKGAQALGNLGVPCFVFQEGTSEAVCTDYPSVEHVFRQIANLSKGAYGRFDAGAADQLARLLDAVAAYAAGGIEALSNRRDEAAVKLLEQLIAAEVGQ